MLKVKLCPNLINKDIDHLFMKTFYAQLTGKVNLLRHIDISIFFP